MSFSESDLLLHQFEQLQVFPHWHFWATLQHIRHQEIYVLQKHFTSTDQFERLKVFTI